jgi:hypothetical protein
VLATPGQPYHSEQERLFTMGSSTTPKPTKPTILDIEMLNAVALRLRERSDQIVQVTPLDWAVDLKLAARCADLLAHIRFELGEVITKTTDHDTRLSLKNLLEDASVAEPGVGQP